MPRKKITTKKTVTKKSPRTPRRTSISSASKSVPIMATTPAAVTLEKLKQNKALYGIAGLGIIVLLLLVFPLRFLIVPVIVNGQPIFSWQYVGELHKQAGEEILNQMINQKLIEQEIASQNIQVTESEVNEQLKQLEDQIGTESGGLDAMLALQGISRQDLIKRIQFIIGRDKLIKGTITVSDEEVKKELSANTAIYKDLSEVDAATTAAEGLRQQKMSQAFNEWFQKIRQNAKIQNSFQSPATPLPKSSSK